MLVGRYNRSHRTNAPSEPILIDKSDCSRDFSKKMTKKYRDTHKKIKNCNEFDNSLNFAKVSLYFFKIYRNMALHLIT